MIYLILTGFCFGSIGIFVKKIGASISPLGIAIIRLLTTAFLMFLLVSTRRSFEELRLQGSRDLVLVLLGGLVGFGATMGFYIKSLQIIPVADAVFLHFVSFPLFTLLYTIFLTEDRIEGYDLASFTMALLGIFFIYGVSFQPHSQHYLGYTFGFISGVCYSLMMIFMKVYGTDKTLYGTIFWPVLIGGLGLVPFGILEGLTFQLRTGTLYHLAGLVVISTFLGYTLMARGVASVKAHHASIALIIAEPLSAVLLAWLVLGEALSLQVGIGGALILLSSILLYRRRSPDQPVVE
ncbi:MAG: DMT family transporter [Candidatus Bipolaricaulota bacterium]